MTADLVLLRQREQLLSARIASTEDPFLRDNLESDRQKILAQIEALSNSAAGHHPHPPAPLRGFAASLSENEAHGLRHPDPP